MHSVWDVWALLGPPVSAWMTGRVVVRLARGYTVRFGIVRFFSVGLIIAAAAVLAADTLTGHAAGAVLIGFLLGGVIVLGITQMFSGSDHRRGVLLVLEMTVLGSLIAAWHAGAGAQALLLVSAVSVRTLAIAFAEPFASATTLACPIAFALAGLGTYPLLLRQQHTMNDVLLAALAASAVLFGVEEFVAHQAVPSRRVRLAGLLCGLLIGAILHAIGHRLIPPPRRQVVRCTSCEVTEATRNAAAQVVLIRGVIWRSGCALG